MGFFDITSPNDFPGAIDWYSGRVVHIKALFNEEVKMFHIKNQLLTVLVSLCFILISIPAFGQGNTATNPESAKLFVNSGGANSVKKFEKQLLAKYSKKLNSSYEKIPEEFWDDFFDVMTPEGEIETIFESTFRVYGEIFTPDEIKLLNRYLMVPVLQKWIKLSPKISAEQASILEKESQVLLEDSSFNTKLKKLHTKYEFDKKHKSIYKYSTTKK